MDWSGLLLKAQVSSVEGVFRSVGFVAGGGSFLVGSRPVAVVKLSPVVYLPSTWLQGALSSWSSWTESVSRAVRP